MSQIEIPPETSALFAGFAARREIVPHVCAVCGAAFQAIKKARYCSDVCRFRAGYARRRKPAPDAQTPVA